MRESTVRIFVDSRFVSGKFMLRISVNKDPTGTEFRTGTGTGTGTTSEIRYRYQALSPGPRPVPGSVTGTYHKNVPIKLTREVMDLSRKYTYNLH